MGPDGVVHLGGLADEAPFDDLCAVNILGTFNVVEASRLAGAARFVYASSNRVTGFYAASTVVDPDVVPRPDSLYAVRKPEPSTSRRHPRPTIGRVGPTRHP
jgi:uronate dehydrogenase